MLPIWVSRIVFKSYRLKSLDLFGDTGFVVGPGCPFEGKTYEASGTAITDLSDQMQSALQGNRFAIFDARARGWKRQGIATYPKWFAVSHADFLDSLRKTDPNLGYFDWLHFIWNAMRLFGDECHADLIEWSKGITRKAYDHKAFLLAWGSYDPREDNPELSPAERLKAIRNANPRLMGWLNDIPHEGRTHAETVLKKTLSFIEAKGNSPTEEHKRQLRFLARALIGLLSPADRDCRLAIPLFAGAGKTVSVAAFAKVMTDAYPDRGCWIAVETVDQIEELLGLTREMGLTDKDVGARHAGMTDDVSDKQILIVTHERIRQNLYREEDLHVYKGTERVLVWDEALISTCVQFYSVEAIVREIGNWRSVYALHRIQGTASELEIRTAAFFDAFLMTLETAQGRGDIALPVANFKLHLTGYSSDLLLDLARRKPSSAILDNQKNVFWYSIQVPDEFSRAVILDASAKYRRLETLGAQAAEGCLILGHGPFSWE